MHKECENYTEWWNQSLPTQLNSEKNNTTVSAEVTLFSKLKKRQFLKSKAIQARNALL